MSEKIQQTTEADGLNSNKFELSDKKQETSDDLQGYEEPKPYDLNLIDVKEIKLDTQEGRFNYLTSIVGNGQAIKSEQLRVLESGFYEHICKAEPIFRDFDSAGVDSLQENTRRELNLISAQKIILQNLDFSNSSVIQALKTQSEQYYKKAKADGIVQTAAEKFLLMHEAADNLYLIMVDEVKQRKQQNESAKAETQEMSEAPATSERIEYPDVEEVNYALELERKQIDLNNRIIARDTSNNPGSVYAAKIDREMAQGVVDTLISWQNIGDETPVVIWLEGQRRSKQATLDRCPKDENGEPTGDFAARLSNELIKLYNTGASLVRARKGLELRKNNETVKVDTQEEAVDSIPSQGVKKDVLISELEVKPAASYSIEGGLVDAPITLVVGQEIPNDWFNSKNVGEKNDSGFGILISVPPRIETVLHSIVNIEYSKINENERHYYDYQSIIKKVNEVARETKRVPDVTSIVKSSRKS